MKLIMIFLLAAFYQMRLKAQTYDELFRQKETQTKYLLKQVAGLQIYLSYARKGYEVIQKGSQVVQSLKEIDFKEHQTFFKSLDKLNAHLPIEEKEKAMTIQSRIRVAHQQFLNQISSSKFINGDEKQALKNQLKILQAGINNEVKILTDLEKASYYQLSDKERWGKIETHYQNIQSYQKTSWSLRNDIKELIQYRKQAAKEVENSQQINGLKP